MTDMLPYVALFIGYATMILGGIALSVIVAWWCFEVVAKHFGLTKKILAAVWEREKRLKHRQSPPNHTL